MTRTSRRSARILVAVVSVVALLATTAPQDVRGWANAGDGYSTHDWVVDQALHILDTAGRRPAWFDRDLALPLTDDPDTVERAADPSRGWEHVYYDMTVHGGAVQRISEHYTAALDALGAGDATAATVNVALLSHFLSDISQPYHTARAGYGRSKLHAAYEAAVGSRTRTQDSAPEWADATQPVSAITDIRRTAAATAAYSRVRFADLDRAWVATGDVDDPTVTKLTGEVLKRAARDLANVIWSLDQRTGRSPDMASLGASIKWVGVRRGAHDDVVRAKVLDSHGNGIRGAEVQISWPLPNGTRKVYRTWTGWDGVAERAIPVGRLPMLRRQIVPMAAIVNGATIERSRWFIPSPKLDSGRAGFKTVVSDATPALGQNVKVISRARDTSGRPVAGLLVTWVWDLGDRTVRTSGITNASGRAFSYLRITSRPTSGTVTVKAHVQAYSVNRYSSASLRVN